MLGDVGLELEAREFAPGSVLLGRFAFRLHQPKQCRQACVQVRAVENYVEYERDWNDHDRYERHERSRQLYEQTVVLAGEGSYHQGIHPFRLQIPGGAPSTYSGSSGGSQWDPVSSVMEWMEGSHHHHGHHDSQRSVHWEVRGWLDIPWGTDPVARESILVHPSYALRRDGSADWDAARCNHHHQPAYPVAPLAPAPRPVAPVSASRFCMHCGAKALKPGARFCNSCGQAMV